MMVDNGKTSEPRMTAVDSKHDKFGNQIFSEATNNVKWLIEELIQPTIP